MKPKILEIGPSDTKAKGGMSTVIKGIRDSKVLNQEYDIDIFASYRDGNYIFRFLYASYRYLKFLRIYQNYDLFHIHVAAYGSTLRKGFYLRKIKKAGKKAIVHIHGSKYLVFLEGLNDRNKKKVITLLQSADRVIGLSDYWKNTFEQLLGLTNCISVPNGIDAAAFSGAVTDPEKYRNAFLMLGRLGERKGAYDLIRAVEIAVRQNPDIKVYMAGDGEVDKIRETVRKKGLERNIEVPGWADQEKKTELLKRSATLVLPSYNEGLPMSILEGMASGKAIISTTVGAIPEVVRKENGILIEPGDVNALASAIVKCASDPEMLGRMSQNNRKKIEKEYNIEVMHRKISQCYQSILGLPQNPDSGRR